MTKNKKIKKNIISLQMSWRDVSARLLGRFHIRRNYKDRLFISLFQDKKELLELYNALNGSHYTDPELLEITTLSDMVYMGIKNDCSFIISNYLNLYEHQSTINPNMPIRGLNYFASIYRTYIQMNKLDIYGSTLVKLPTPRYVIFYNGEKELPDRSELRLSDAFEESDGCLECVATVININLGHNEGIMNNCRTLFDYARFVDKVREFHAEGCNHAEAVDRAVTYCIENDILREFLAKNRSEVCYMFDTDYSEKKFWEMKKYNYEKALQEKDDALAEKDSVIAEKDDALAEKDSVIAEKDDALAEKDSVIAEKDDALAKKDSVIAEKDSVIAEQDEELARQKEEIIQLKKQLAKSNE
ncbi:MAG: hypothetical protein ACI4A3_07755 [Lachnospiraceae bacterium]